MPKSKAHMICHTHWDREWYLTLEQFRPKLVRLIDRALDMVDTLPEGVSFMLDGQFIVIEDYLQVRPQNEERIRKAIRAGKLYAGPWYMLPDEVLISGESHIRNYLMGERWAKRLGGKMNIGYLPDSFGHPAQMPQILEGLSMDSIVFWRGTDNRMEKSEFYWQSPYEKSRVLCVHMANGYGNSARLSADMEETLPRLNGMIDDLHSRSTGDTVLLMNGSDHILWQSDIVKIVQEYNQKTENRQVVLSSLEQFVEEIQQNLPEDLATHTGQIRSGDRSMLLGSTMSARMPLKQKNFQVQNKMERYIEPIASGVAMLGGAKGFADYQTLLWRRILENHPHDSICGCSIDEVHREMETRFAVLQQLQETLLLDLVQELAAKTQPAQDVAGHPLVFFAASQGTNQGYAQVTVDLNPMLVNRVNYTRSDIEEHEHEFVHPDAPENITVTDDTGRVLEAVVLECEKAYQYHFQDETAPEVYKVNRCKLGILLPETVYGLHTLTLTPATGKPAAGLENTGFIENEFYKVSYSEKEGGFTVYDKTTNQEYLGVGRLVDKGDAGDEYTYSWPQTDRCFTSKGIGVVQTSHKNPLCQQLQVKYTLLLPKELSGDRKSRGTELVENLVEIQVSLAKETRRVDFSVHYLNKAKDHLLLAEIPAGLLADQSLAYEAFAVIPHEITPTVPDKWREYPLPMQPTQGMVQLGNAQKGVAVAAPGITEYQAENREEESYLQLTLLRSVGWLSRTDLLTRLGNGGWSLPTPEAQCIGDHTFQFSLQWHEEGWRTSFAQLESVLHPVEFFALPPGAKPFVFALNPLAFVSQLPKDVWLSGIKLAEDGNGWVVRLFSIAETACQMKLEPGTMFTKATLCNLREQDTGENLLTHGKMPLSIAPGQIISFRLSL